MSDQPSNRRDVNQAAHHTIQSIIDRTEPPTPAKNLAAVALGRLGGLKGGKARAAKLTPEQRREIAFEGCPCAMGEPPADGMIPGNSTATPKF